MSTTELAREAHRLLRELIDLDAHERCQRLSVLDEDSPLRREVEELLAASEQASAFLEDAAFTADADDLGPERFVGSRIGGYVLDELLGRGGMGTVFRARQEDPPRTVALKLMNPDLLDQRALSRFRGEVRALALLEHPGIARLYGSGAWDAGFGGVPWYAMELVEDGRRITDFATERQLSRARRIELFLEACSAVHYGHQKGIIHRDLKPANLLVGRDGRVRVIDFGVARMLGEHEQTVTRTSFGGAIGTIRYMSPEQLTSDAAGGADVRADVYALGVVLYELLCEHSPYDLGGKGFLEVARVVRETPPARPTQHDPSLKGDLEAVMLKALARDRGERYQSVAELAHDLERFLEHRPVHAHPPNFWRHLALVALRHRAVVAVTSAAALLLVAATIVSTTLAVKLDREGERRAFVAYQTSLFAAEAAWRQAKLHPMRHRLGLAPEEFRDWEWHLLDRLAHPSTRPLLGHRGRVHTVAFSPSGRRLISSSADGTLRIWDTGTRRARGTVSTPLVPLVAVWSLDGRRVAAGTQEGKIFEYELDGPDHFELVRTVDASTDRIGALSYGSGGSLWIACWDGTVRHLETGSDEPSVLRGDLGRQRAIARSSDGSTLWSAGDSGLVHVWDSTSRSRRSSFEAHESEIHAIAAHPQGEGILTGAWDGVVRKWDSDTSMAWEIKAHPQRLRTVAFHPSGESFATGSPDNTVAVWSSRDGRRKGVFRGHERTVIDAEYHPNGSLLATASWDDTVNLIPTELVVDPNVMQGHSGHALCVAASPTGHVAASGDKDGHLILWNTKVRTAIRSPIVAHTGELRCMDFRSDGRILATGGADGTVAFWDVESGAFLRRTERRTGVIHALRFIGDGSELAFAGSEGSIHIESETAPPRTLPGHQRGVRVLAIDPRGEWLASGGDDHLVRLWRLDGSEPTRVLEAHGERVFALAFHPDGHRLASASHDRVLCMWDVESAQLIDIADGHGQFIYSLAWHPDGQRLAAASWYGAVQIWQTEPLTELLLLHDHADVVRSVAFTRDGRYLLSAGYDTTVRVWDGAPRE